MNNNGVNKDPSAHHEPLTELLGQLVKNSAALAHDEIELAIQRIREKTRAVRSGVILVATGAVISFAAFISLCTALIIALAYYMPPAIAALVTGVALALAGVVIASIGYRHLKK